MRRVLLAALLALAALSLAAQPPSRPAPKGPIGSAICGGLLQGCCPFPGAECAGNQLHCVGGICQTGGPHGGGPN